MRYYILQPDRGRVVIMNVFSSDGEGGKRLLTAGDEGLDPAYACVGMDVQDATEALTILAIIKQCELRYE